MGYTQWFLSLSPLNLLLFISLIFWNVKEKRVVFKALLIPFMIGMFVEFLGVNYGLIFGSYQYGANLGFKIKGVPLMIGVNWAILTFVSTSITRNWIKNSIASSISAAVLMVSLDLVIEIAAPTMDYWRFKDGIVPLQNYIGWLGTAFVVNLFFQKINRSYHFKLSLHLYLAMLLFFLIFIAFI